MAPADAHADVDGFAAGIGPVEVISSALAASPAAAAGAEQRGMVEIVLIGGLRVQVRSGENPPPGTTQCRCG
nr:hypothetical protein [Mesorhizobium sp.]